VLEELMKITMVIPTYWGREKATGWQPGDLVFDHPTPLDGQDTLGRFLKSLNVLDTTDFTLALVIVPTSAELTERAVTRVRSIIDTSKPPVKPLMLTPAVLRTIAESTDSGDRYDELLSLSGYAHVRNGCLLAAAITDADVAVLIDDDELFELPDFLTRVRDGIDRLHNGEEVRCLAGYYLNPDGNFRLEKKLPQWGQQWPKYQVMDQGFEEIIAQPPRYKKTPFVFGGNLSIRNDVFKSLPFDTRVTRGEDIDYLMMALMSGIPTILDNELHIKHKAPPKSHPQWQQFRQDVIRFAFQRAKIKAVATGSYPGINAVSAVALDPYPGFFLKEDLDERVVSTAHALAEYYHSQNDKGAAEEALATIRIFQQHAQPEQDPITAFVELRTRWRELIEHVVENDYEGLLE
jgi:hypothetical protein